MVLAPEVGSVCDCEGCRRSNSESEFHFETVRVPVVARKGGLIRRALSAAATDLDPVSNWPKAAIATAERIVQRQPVDAIWATATPFSSLWAADRLARRFNLPWIADIRDSLALKWNPIHYRNVPTLVRLRRILRGASTVVEAWPEHAAYDGEWLGRSCEWITSGFEPNDWVGVTRSRPETTEARLEIVCAGKIYPGYRTLGPAFAGLRRLLDADPRAAVRLSYFGRSDDLVRRDAARYGLDAVVKCRGFVSPDELRARLASADILLLPTSHARGSNTPGGKLRERLGAKRHLEIPGGKLYEYLGARRPILAVPGEDRFVVGVLEETRAGRTAASPEEVAEALSAWLDERSSTRTVAYGADEDVVNRYSIRESARRLAALLDATAEGRKAAPSAQPAAAAAAGGNRR